MSSRKDLTFCDQSLSPGVLTPQDISALSCKVSKLFIIICKLLHAPPVTLSTIICSRRSKQCFTISGLLALCRALDSEAGALSVRLGCRRQKDCHHPLVTQAPMPFLSNILVTIARTSCLDFGYHMAERRNKNLTSSPSSSMFIYGLGPLVDPTRTLPLIRSPRVDFGTPNLIAASLIAIPSRVQASIAFPLLVNGRSERRAHRSNCHGRITHT